MKKLTTEEKLDKLEKNQNKLLESLVEEKKAREKAEKALETKEVKEKKEDDPMSGPGKLCECIKITRSEAWQVPSVEIVNPETQTVETKPDMSKVPEGYVVRQDFIVKAEYEDKNKFKDLQKIVIPNCHSKYTRELTVYTSKLIQDRGNFKKEPPRITVHLCEKHEQMYNAKTQKVVDKEKKDGIS